MGKPAHHHNRVILLLLQLLFWIVQCAVVVPTLSSSVGSSLPYTKNAYTYQHSAYASPHVNMSTSSFQPRDSTAGVGGTNFGTTGGSYGVVGGAQSYDLGGVGGGYSSPVAAAVPAVVPAVYRYQIFENQMKGQNMGWGDEEEDDDDDKDFPKELIGLLGLLGLKGLKGGVSFGGIQGIISGVKGLIFLKKLAKSPLLPIALPILLPLLAPLLAPLLLPLLLFKLLKLLLLAALILFFPVLVIPGGGRSIFQVDLDQGRNLTQFLQEKVNTIMPHLPEDLRHIVDKIKNGKADNLFANIFNNPDSADSLSVEAARKAPVLKKWTHSSNKLGDKGNPRTKITYVSGDSVANIMPTEKTVKFVKLDKNKKDISKS